MSLPHSFGHILQWTWSNEGRGGTSMSSDLSLPEDVSPDRWGLLVALLPTEQRCAVDWQGAGLSVTGVTAREGRRLLCSSKHCRWLKTQIKGTGDKFYLSIFLNQPANVVPCYWANFQTAVKEGGHTNEAGVLTWRPEEPAFGSMVRPRVTPPLRAFFRLSFTSVNSSSRFTRSSSFCLHSSSTLLSRSDSDACERLPDERRDRFKKLYQARCC